MNEMSFREGVSMYLNIQETADYLEVPVSEIQRLIRERQIRTISVDDDILLNRDQFNFFIEQREKYKYELEAYLNTPLPEDPDIKDED
jgi:excisionase family DNA binding protein